MLDRQIKARNIKRKRDVLEFRNDRFYENGKYLPKKELTLVFSAHEGMSLISGLTGQKYRDRDLINEYGYFPYSL